MDILNHGKKYVLFLLISFIFQNCKDQPFDREVIYYKKIQSIISDKESKQILKRANDSLGTWIGNSLDNYRYHKQGKYFILDTLLCYNQVGDRFISALLNINEKNPNSDGMDYFYGEKINNLWYFFRGAYIVIPREMVKGHDVHKPLSYQQLHEIALKEIYGGYLKRNGEINEEWFTNQFEGPGWVHWDDTPEKVKKYTRKDYENLHLEVIRNNWYVPKHDSIKSSEKKKSIP